MAQRPSQNVEDVPDPDEDDLDDLDEVLDEFQATSISQAKPPSTSIPNAPSASGPGRPSSEAQSSSKTAPSSAAKQDAGSEEDFAKQLQAGMSSLISELDSNPQMQAEFEKMMQELIAAGAAPSDQEAGEHLQKAAQVVPKAPPETTKPQAGGSGSSKSANQDAAFQDTIKRTMQRMQASDTAASTSTASAGTQSEEDMLAAMMRELTEGGGGAGGEADFNTMLMNMMAHLTNKEILYDPMKELHDKFPPWMEKNAATCGQEDLARYREQQRLVGEIVGRFERKGYSDENEEDREYIVERMQKMQAEGQPPSDLVGDMSAAQEALGDLDQGCPTQ